MAGRQGHNAKDGFQGFQPISTPVNPATPESLKLPASSPAADPISFFDMPDVNQQYSSYIELVSGESNPILTDGASGLRVPVPH
jgi:hypothetical protein